MSLIYAYIQELAKAQNVKVSEVETKVRCKDGVIKEIKAKFFINEEVEVYVYATDFEELTESFNEKVAEYREAVESERKEKEELFEAIEREKLYM